ncbi:hypothetical protein DM860_001154 [Cuscuta australis]|nr:hypothetical protein DM860_001154 [Cuscuta australis]
MKPRDVFDEWEFCASDFSSTDGKYIHFKDKELNATFLCPECAHPVGPPQHSGPSNEKAMTHWAFIVVIGATVSVVFALGMVTSYKLWQKRKRQQEQARFIRLFEGDDDVDDEFGFSPLSHVT